LVANKVTFTLEISVTVSFPLSTRLSGSTTSVYYSFGKCTSNVKSYLVEASCVVVVHQGYGSKRLYSFSVNASHAGIICTVAWWAVWRYVRCAFNTRLKNVTARAYIGACIGVIFRSTIKCPEI